jgi:hypothetical protein
VTGGSWRGLWACRDERERERERGAEGEACVGARIWFEGETARFQIWKRHDFRVEKFHEVESI